MEDDLFHDPIAYFQGAGDDFFVVVSGYFLLVIDGPEVRLVPALLQEVHVKS